jgi:ferredoxin
VVIFSPVKQVNIKDRWYNGRVMAEPDGPPPDGNARPFEKVRIYVEGEEWLVPASVTILDALILSGHRSLRGCGCREGDCGECAVVVRAPGAHHPGSELACEVRLRPDIRISRIPFQWNRAYRDQRRAGR